MENKVKMENTNLLFRKILNQLKGTYDRAVMPNKVSNSSNGRRE
jgi:hypothetical protein